MLLDIILPIKVRARKEKEVMILTPRLSSRGSKFCVLQCSTASAVVWVLNVPNIPCVKGLIPLSSPSD